MFVSALVCLHVWRAALASRLRVAHLPLAAANRSRAFRCRAHASRTHAPLALVACACARALLVRCPPRRWLPLWLVNALRPPPAARKRGVDSAAALRLACGAPRGRPPGSLRLCTARGHRFGGAPLAPRLAAAGWRFSRPPRRRRLQRRKKKTNQESRTDCASRRFSRAQIASNFASTLPRQRDDSTQFFTIAAANEQHATQQQIISVISLNPPADLLTFS